MNDIQMLSIRMFYLKHKTPNSCSYYAFTRKMNRLKDKLGHESGISNISPTLSLIDLSKSDIYLKLMERSSDQVTDIISKLN